MLKRKSIAIFLSLLLFVFFNNNLPCEVYTSYGQVHSAVESVLKQLVKTSSGPDLSFSKPTVKRDHIKVRYMGGECSFDVSEFSVNITTPEFVDAPLNFSHTFFIPGSNPFLFTLRGPPGC